MGMSQPCAECISLDNDGPVIAFCGAYFCDDCFVEHHCGRCDTSRGQDFNVAAFEAEMTRLHELRQESGSGLCVPGRESQGNGPSETESRRESGEDDRIDPASESKDDDAGPRDKDSGYPWECNKV